MTGKAVGPRVVLLLVLLLIAGPAGAVPFEITYTGRLLENGNPVEGPLSLSFGIFPSPSGGGASWSETHDSVQITGGMFTVQLGSVTPLDPVIFDDP